MPIAYTHDGQSVVSWEGRKINGSPLSANETAAVLGLGPGSWREITEAEAEALQAPTLEEARAAKLADVMAAYDTAFAPLEAVYPAKERETWTAQLEEARAVLKDPETKTPMLTVMAADRGLGETVVELARKIIANDEYYRLLAGTLTAQQQRMYREINALESVKSIQDYPVAFQTPEDL